jgi:hypothetical protein
VHFNLEVRWTAKVSVIMMVGLQKMKSDTEMEMVFKSQLVSLQNQQQKRGKKKAPAK